MVNVDILGDILFRLRFSPNTNLSLMAYSSVWIHLAHIACFLKAHSCLQHENYVMKNIGTMICLYSNSPETLPPGVVQINVGLNCSPRSLPNTDVLPTPLSPIRTTLNTKVILLKSCLACTSNLWLFNSHGRMPTLPLYRKWDVFLEDPTPIT